MSVPREDSVYLKHIRDAIGRIESYLDGVSEPSFLETPIIQDAVIRQIQIIGEAAKRISPMLREMTPKASVAPLVADNHVAVATSPAADSDARHTPIDSYRLARTRTFASARS